MTTLEQELRSTQQELAESRRYAEDQTTELAKAKAQIIELHNELAANYESSVPIATQIVSIIQQSSNVEFENLNKQLAECHRKMIKQQKEHEEKVHDLQQRHGMTTGHLQSKNNELQTQLEDKTKELEQTVAKLDEREKTILEARNCETDLRSEVKGVRAQKEQIEKNFKKVSAELDKARTERKAAQDRLDQYKNFADQVGQNYANLARQVENTGLGSPVLQIKRTPPDANQHEQGASASKRSRHH
ncbi:hypothetical protein DdX_11962 [Ditylenchus destructor]|uniref:Uncharacterized protein n=1 Tax=Ditylenchus destructor TaxID=166010 RepID=A0AAD4MW09_9BILA|nr:hypothetical protein DdX_11962 [Ditylenchus destructor]